MATDASVDWENEDPETAEAAIRAACAVVTESRAEVDAATTAAIRAAVDAAFDEDPKAGGSLVAAVAGRSGLPLYLDLETVPDYERMESFGLAPVEEARPVKLSGDCMPVADFLTGPLTIVEERLERDNPEDAYLDALVAFEATSAKPRAGVADRVKALRAKRAAAAGAEGERRKLLSVTPEYCRIAAVGWAIGNGETHSVIVYPEMEVEALATIWDLVSIHRPIVGFNILGFDLNVIKVRSCLLGVEPSCWLSDSPYGNRDVVDLMLARFGKGGKAKKLKELARLYGIPVPAGDCDGSQVEALLASDSNKVGEYVRSDVEITRELHRKWAGVFCV